VVERIGDMPEGTIGLLATGKVTSEEYRETIEPVLRAAAEQGEVRLMFVFGKGAQLSSGALMEDARAGLSLGFGHQSAWKRTALVTDLEWVKRSFRLFSWIAPGEIEIYELAELAAAKAWVAA
jgi:SpoIIAA-like